MNVLKKILQQYRKIDVVARASLWFMFCNIIQHGMSIITTPIFTRLLTTDEYGIVTVYQTWYNVILVLVTLQICYAPLNNAMVKFSNEKNKLLSSMQSFLVFSSVIWFLFFILFGNQFSILRSLPRIAIMLGVFHAFSSASMSLWVAYQRFEYHYIKLVAFTIMYAVLNTVLGITLVLFMDNGWLARILSMTISQGIFGVSLCFVNLFKGKTFYSRKFWKYSIKFGITLLPNSFCSLLLNHADRLVIQQLCGDTEVAYYGLAYSIGTLTNLVKDALSHAFMPWFYKNLDSGKDKQIQKRLSALLWMMLMMISLVLIIMPEIVLIMGGSKYEHSLQAIPPIAASVFFMFLSTPIINIQYYYNKLLASSICSIFAVVLNLGLNIALVPVYGYVTAGYTTLLSYGLITLAEYFYTSYLLKQNLRTEVLDHKNTLVLSFCMLVVMALSPILYTMPLIRYFCIGIICIVLFIYRKQMIQYITDNLLKKDNKI